MIPVNAGESLPSCPSRCADPIWSFFNEKWYPPAGETREVSEPFPALDVTGDPRRIPAGARLTDVRLGPQPANRPDADPKLVSFRFDGQAYFGSADELFRKTKAPGA